MRKLMALVMVLAMLVVSIGFAETVEETAAPSAAEIAAQRPEKTEETHITVANTTKVSGNFFTTCFGNNTSDIDVRQMIHGYNPIVWESQVKFILDPQVVTRLTSQVVDGNTVYTFELTKDMVYSDGTTPVTAQDYVFSWLLSASKELIEVGGEAPVENILGWDEYHKGESGVLAGLHLLGDYSFSVTVKGDYTTYFYDFAQLSIQPFPISVIAPGCVVADDGEGAYVKGDSFNAESLKKTLLDETEGYVSHPSIVCGPYTLESYDAATGTVEFKINPYYKGNFEGVKPWFDAVTLVPASTDTMVDQLKSGEIGLLNKCVDASVINDALDRMEEEEASSMVNYARLGYGFCALSCEQGPQQFQAVRQALAYAFDAEAFVQEYIGGYGMAISGYFGIGQWMAGACLGNVRPIDMNEEDIAAWDALSLDSLNSYAYDLEAAEKLLVEDGWTLNAEGGEYTEGLRYKDVDGTLMPLSFRFAKCAGNDGAELVVKMYNESLAQLGGELVVEEVPFTELLSDYYRDNGERKFDMNFMATNFVSTFDPYHVFSNEASYQGSVNTSGVYDEELANLAWDLRNTPAGELLTYLHKWIKMEERFNEVLPTLPIYSNMYFDFFTDDLQNYYANSETNWPIALLYSYMSDAETAA